jgi:hypothetical protein
MKSSIDSFRNEGSVSEWNEGNFKNLRLHEAQELINTGKMNPLKNFDNSWNYEQWIDGITILYGEGNSKYSDKEIIIVEKTKEIIFARILLYPPFSKSIQVKFGKKKVENKLNYANWNFLRKLIEVYEKQVKYFNDIHGLSTRNYDYDDEGL